MMKTSKKGILLICLGWQIGRCRNDKRNDVDTGNERLLERRLGDGGELMPWRSEHVRDDEGGFREKKPFKTAGTVQ